MHSLPDNSKIIVRCARYTPEKDFGTLLLAARQVCLSDKRVFFLLCGRDINWLNAELVSQVENLGLRDRIRLLGEVEAPEELLAGADLAVSSSWSEAFGNSIIEAMIVGTIPVVTDVGCSALIVGRTDLTCARRSPRLLAAALEKWLAATESELCEMRNYIRNRAATEFSVAESARHYYAIYKDLSRHG
jgi:glycosyltransferase involved in cell wall biosynthesis